MLDAIATLRGLTEAAPVATGAVRWASPTVSVFNLPDATVSTTLHRSGNTTSLSVDSFGSSPVRSHPLLSSAG